LALFDLTSLFRNLSDFPFAPNNIFPLNEVLAPSAGRVPGANFVPQYTILMGWLVAPFRSLASAYTLASTATIALSCLSIAAVVLAVVLARRSLPERSLWLAVGLTVPLATVTAFHNPIDSSIGSYLQDLPVRMFPAMLYSVLGVSSLLALLQHSVRRVSLVLLGLLAGLMAWNSQDFGLAVAVAYGIVLQVATRGALRKRATVLWLGGLVPGVILYPLWAGAIGHPIQFKYFGLTARSFGSGFASVPIQVPGPVLLVLPVILGSVAVGGTLLWRAAEGSIDVPKFQQHAVVTLAFVGTWSTLGFVYYLNRSYASGQLQLFLLPVGVCCCALLSLCYACSPLRIRGPGPIFRSFLKGRALWLLPVTLPVAVGFGAILQTPSPSIVIRELVHPAASSGFFSTVPVHEVSVAKTYVQTHGGGPIGYIGPNANYLKLANGLEPRILYDDPADYSISKAALRLGCSYVRRHPTRWLLAVRGVTTLLGDEVCRDYVPWPISGEPANSFFRLRRSL